MGQPQPVPLTKRQKAEKYRQMLKLEYANGWRPHHQDISTFIQPRRARFLSSDRQAAGTRKNDRIVNNIATEASDTLRAGLTSGVTSRSRPWYRLTTHDPTLVEDDDVKGWLHEAERISQMVLAKSNFYLRIEELYGDLGDFGTAVMIIEEDPDEYIRCYVLPVGSYVLASSANLSVDTLFRDTQMTVAQLVEKFGYEQCCRQVQQAHDAHNLYQFFDVVHYIMPNADYREGSLDPTERRWSSCWYEEARTEDEGRGFLRESGYDYCPFMAPRWKVTGNDTYGTSPGMNCLGDVIALQHLEEQAMGLVDKQVNPPMNVPPSMRGQQASLLPGAENPTAAGEQMTPAIVVHPQALDSVELKIRQHEGRIRTSYHADLFRLLEQYQNGQMTAYEVAQRIQEKMQLLGPAYERTEEELCDPALDAVLHILFENFALPPAPPQLQGAEIKAEYTSIIAQAQKAAGTGALRELLQLVGNLAAVDHDVLDNIDFDRAVQEYATMLGVPPKLLRSPEAVKAIRQMKAQMARQAQMQQQAAQLAAGAKTLSETDTSGDNALTKMLDLGVPGGSA